MLKRIQSTARMNSCRMAFSSSVVNRRLPWSFDTEAIKRPSNSLGIFPSISICARICSLSLSSIPLTSWWTTLLVESLIVSPSMGSNSTRRVDRLPMPTCVDWQSTTLSTVGAVIAPVTKPGTSRTSVNHSLGSIPTVSASWRSNRLIFFDTSPAPSKWTRIP